MGCGPSRPPPENGFRLDDKRAVFRPPPQPEDEDPKDMKKFFSSSSSRDKVSTAKRPEQAPPQYTSQNKAKEVARCAALLREMYGLDLEIWAMEEAHEDDLPEREHKKQKADALFAEIRRIVGTWRASGGWGWEQDEWKCVQDICEVVGTHKSPRYR
ncbi:hypothetical protein EG329_012160 [Mollisiaceae sp. DMI_Dod_QoI]|nr:hypothetical protein EG329_012160 [Helotiales sp. DMI_Dod_QoI]